MYCDYLKLLLKKYLTYMQDQGLRVEIGYYSMMRNGIIIIILL